MMSTPEVPALKAAIEWLEMVQADAIVGNEAACGGDHGGNWAYVIDRSDMPHFATLLAASPQDTQQEQHRNETL